MKFPKLAGMTLALVLGWCCAAPTADNPSDLNGSFESGANGPTGWTLAESGHAKGEWLEGDSHTGKRALGAKSRGAKRVWNGAPIPVRPGRSYIVDGWVKSTSGSGWLEVDLCDANGKTLEIRRTPRVGDALDWTYTAVEVPTRAESGVATARIAFNVRGGRAALDDVGMHNATATELSNSGFEEPLDKKGRIPYWSEEAESTLHPGTRAGSVAPTKDDAFEGAACLAVTASGAWFAVSTVPNIMWPWTESVEVSSMARCEAGTEVRLGTLWMDAAQKCIGVGVGAPAEGSGWQRVSSGPLMPPAESQTFKPVLLVHRKDEAATGPGTAWFDCPDVCVREKHALRVEVNQVGYDTQGPKGAVLLTNFFPKKGLNGAVELAGADGKRVWKSKIRCAGRMYGQKEADWGWYFWRIDFSPVQKDGKYTVSAKVGSDKGESYPFVIEKDVLFRETAEANVDFFYVQRCGCEVPGWHAPCHMDGAKLKDGTHRDLIGGWHSAGDYNKLAWEYGDSGVMYSLAHAAEVAPEYFAQSDRNKDGLPDVLDEAEWGAKYVAKIQEPSTGGVLNHIEQGPDRKTWMNWCPPEKTTDNIVGTADDPIVTAGEGSAPLAIGGWAVMSKLLKARGVDNDYLERAVRLWNHATAPDGANSSPLLLISTIDLYRVSGQESYLAYCRKAVEILLATGNPDGQLPSGYGESGDIPAAALAYFALTFPADPLSPKIKTRLEKHLPGFLAEAHNPLGLMMQESGPDGYYFEPTSTLGCNFQICCRAWSALMVYRVTHDRRALQYALDQLDFVLGKNPYGLCMMEGKGSYNLPRYHHRYITIPGHERGAVPGAIPNGFVRDIVGNDRPGVDLSTGGRPYPSYRTNEPWLVHNVFYTMAVTALHQVENETMPQ